MTSILEVRLHGTAIGSLTMLPSRKVFFSFYEDYANDSDRCILSQSFFRPSGELIPESGSSSGKLPAFFSNLLPEGHMRDYLAQLGNIKPTAEFSLIGNGDLHLKNWSFIYLDSKTATLAPAYDLVATVPYLPNDNLALKLYKTKVMKDISLELFRKMAGKSKLPEHMVLQTAQDAVDATLTAWKDNYATFGLPTQLIESIDRHITTGTNMYHGI